MHISVGPGPPYQRTLMTLHPREGRATGGRAGYGIVLSIGTSAPYRAAHNTATGHSPSPVAENWVPVCR